MTDDNNTARASILHEATRLITGDRNHQYGPPTQDFQRTADVLTGLGYRKIQHGLPDGDTALEPIDPHDVAIMVAAVKLSRLMHSPGKRDNWVDLAGYAACGYECTTADPEVT